MYKKRVAIIGRSGSGKSSIIDLFKKNNPEIQIIEEVARNILSKYPSETSEFRQKKMIEHQFDLENSFKEFIADRGIHDYFIFSNRVSKEFTIPYEKLNSRYSLVFKLPRRPYLKEGIRVESDEKEAEEIQQEIEELYMKTNHTLIEVPDLELEEKYNFIREKIESYSG